MTRLDKPLRRELLTGEVAYTPIIDPAGLKVVEKGERNGPLLSWQELVSGDAALTIALRASQVGQLARSMRLAFAARRAGPGT